MNRVIRLHIGTIIAALVAALLWGPGPAGAVTVIVDRFDDGDRTNAVDGINWFTHSHSNAALGISIVDDSTGGLASGNALRVEPITTGQSIMGVFPSPVAVPAAIGSKLTLRFEMRNDFSGLVPATFRFGLYDARVNPTLGGGEETFPNPAGFGGMDGDWDAVDPGSRFDPGVFIQQDNGDACCGLVSSSRLREETGRFGTQFGGGDEVNVAAPPGTTPFPFLNQSNGKNILTIEIERLAAGIDGGALEYTYTINNGVETGVLSGLKRGDIDPLTSDKYDYFSLFYDGTDDGSGNFARWLIDNVTIDVETASAGVAGDYNGNGSVDGADYVLWRKGGPLQNEVDMPGTVNAADYTEWRARFGNSSAGLGGATGVPEPASLLLVVMAAAGAIAVRRR